MLSLMYAPLIQQRLFGILTSKRGKLQEVLLSPSRLSPFPNVFIWSFGGGREGGDRSYGARLHLVLWTISSLKWHH